VATIVSFHAHPDDEAIVSGGTLALAVDAGHRVVLVYATRGELGEVDDGFLDDGETLGERRTSESERAGAVLGAHAVRFLGYRDSGMAGEPTNDDADAFAAAVTEEAAARLAALLEDEHADVLTVYDERGGYGHPDHIKVHDVGVRAARLAATPLVYAATVSKEHFLRFTEESGDDAPPDAPDPEQIDLGVPESRITTRVDVTRALDRKRNAMAAHASQISENSFFLALPPDRFARAFGTEWFIQLAGPPGPPDALV
jgi:LmbE family N-acetylglucosaminyl deacetylase